MLFRYGIGEIIEEVNSGKLEIVKQISIEGKNGKKVKGYTYKCLKCGNKDKINEYNLNYKKGCNVCCVPSKKVLKGVNDLWSTHPEIAKLLKNRDRGYVLSLGSAKREIMLCPECGFEKKNNAIHTIVRFGFSCPACSDGISYPQKFIANLLDQLKLKFETEHVFDWSKNVQSDNLKLSGLKRYDFFLVSKNCIVETHGAQHYNRSFETISKKTLETELENDELKKIIAQKNNITDYIVLDCSKSELEYIKNSALNSKLNSMFNLTKIDWLKCHEFACKSLVREACNLWNSGVKSTVQIGLKLKLGLQAIRNYLKQGAKLGWCDYCPKTAREYAYKICGGHNAKRVVQLTLTGTYIKTWESTAEAQRVLVIKNCISSVCIGNRKSAGGYMWVYESEYIGYENQIEPYKRNKRAVKAVQLSMDNSFIQEWGSLESACVKLNIHKGDISQCLSHNDGFNKPKSSGGYLWYYKSVYEQNFEKLPKYVPRDKRKLIVRTDLEGNYIDEFRGMKEIAVLLNIKSIGNISSVCNGKRNSVAGFKFMYKEDYKKYIEQQKQIS